MVRRSAASAPARSKGETRAGNFKAETGRGRRCAPGRPMLISRHSRFGRFISRLRRKNSRFRAQWEFAYKSLSSLAFLRRIGPFGTTIGEIPGYFPGSREFAGCHGRLVRRRGAVYSRPPVPHRGCQERSRCQQPIAMTEGRLKYFGWGREGEGLTDAEEAAALDRYRRLFRVDRFDEVAPPAFSQIRLRPPRIVPPASLARLCSAEPYDRTAHTYGKSFSDYARGLAGRYDAAPDVVAYPRSEADIAAVIDWAGGAQAALIPFGAGSSVVGGVEARLEGTGCKAAVSLDLRHLDRVLEVDRSSRAARIQGRRLRSGARSPAQAARADPAAFSAELRIFDLGRLDRDPVRRPFRQPLHPHRRSCRKPAHGHAQGSDRDPPAARIGRRTQPRPSAYRLGRHPRRHHRGVDAAPGPAALSRRRRRPLCRFLRRRARGQGDRPGRPLPGELPHPRSAGGAQHRGRRRQRRDHGAGLRIG